MYTLLVHDANSLLASCSSHTIQEVIVPQFRVTNSSSYISASLCFLVEWDLTLHEMHSGIVHKAYDKCKHPDGNMSDAKINREGTI